MTQQPLSNTIDEMEALMNEIATQGVSGAESVVATVPPAVVSSVVEPQPTQLSAVAPASVTTATVTVVAAANEPVATPVAVAPVPAPAPPKNPIQQYVDADRIKQDVAVDPNDLTNACIDQAPNFAYYGQQKVLARRQLDRMKTAFEILEAQLYESKREELEIAAEAEANRRAADESLSKKDREKGAERITDTAVAAAVKKDPRWFRAKNRIIESEAVYNMAAVATQALEQRKDMIVTMGADRRQERAGELHIMEKRGAMTGMEERLGLKKSNMPG